MIVVDASILANAVADDSADGDHARGALRNATDPAAPDLVHVETTSVLRKRWLSGTLTAERFRTAIDDLEALDLAAYPTLPLMSRAFELRDNVSTYDAAYIALAELLDCVLLTADRRLAHAPGIRCEVVVLDPS